MRLTENKACLPNIYENGLSKQGNKTGLRFLLLLKDGSRMKVPMGGQEQEFVWFKAKKGAPDFPNQFPQT